jgi:hypothetical protein
MTTQEIHTPQGITRLCLTSLGVSAVLGLLAGVTGGVVQPGLAAAGILHDEARIEKEAAKGEAARLECVAVFQATQAAATAAEKEQIRQRYYAGVAPATMPTADERISTQWEIGMVGMFMTYPVVAGYITSDGLWWKRKPWPCNHWPEHF